MRPLRSILMISATLGMLALAAVLPAETASTPTTSSDAHPAQSDRLCLLGGRFAVRVDAQDPRTGIVTSGTAVSEGDAFGYFSLPALTGNATLPEVVVKVVDAEVPPWNSDWIFWGA